MSSNRGVVERFIAEMSDEGYQIPISKACSLAGMSRRTYYYMPKRRRPKVNELLAQRIKRLIHALPYAGYRTVGWLLGENKNTVQRIFQIKGWQFRKRNSGHRPRVQSLHRRRPGRMNAGPRTWPASGVASSTAGAP